MMKKPISSRCNGETCYASSSGFPCAKYEQDKKRKLHPRNPNKDECVHISCQPRRDTKTQSKNSRRMRLCLTPLPFPISKRTSHCPQNNRCQRRNSKTCPDKMKMKMRKKETLIKRRHATSLLLPTECTRNCKIPYTNAYQRVSTITYTDNKIIPNHSY